MSNLQLEITEALKTLQQKVDTQHDLSNLDMELLLLTSLIEEEA
jgi:hypothetical protein